MLTKYKGRTTISELKTLPFGDVHIMYYEYIVSAMERAKAEEEAEKKRQAEEKKNANKKGRSEEIGRLNAINVPPDIDAEDLAEELGLD